MDPSISKTTSDQLKYSATVESATTEHGERLAEKVMRMVWDAETPPVSLVLVVRALLALLQVASRALRTADARYVDELADDDPARAERDAAMQALETRITSVMSSVLGALGEVYASKVGLMGPLERRPDMLLRRARTIVRQMRSETAPAPRLDGVTVDVALIATGLDQAAERLATALATVTAEGSEADAALVARDQAGEHWERVVRLVANFMVGLAEVAGEFAIASRIRPTIRRLRGDLEGDDLEGDLIVTPEAPDPATDPLVTDPTAPTDPLVNDPTDPTTT